MDQTSKTLKAFTRQMAYYETKIWQETIISQKSPGHVNNVKNLAPESWIDTIRTQEESLWRRQNSSVLFISVECSIHICTKVFYSYQSKFFWEHARKILSLSPIYPSKRSDWQNTFASVVPICVTPPSGARIPRKVENEMNLSKFWIRNVTRIL